jgi:hypothetical protein
VHDRLQQRPAQQPLAVDGDHVLAPDAAGDVSEELLGAA